MARKRKKGAPVRKRPSLRDVSSPYPRAKSLFANASELAPAFALGPQVSYQSPQTDYAPIARASELGEILRYQSVYLPRLIAFVYFRNMDLPPNRAGVFWLKVDIAPKMVTMSPF